MFENGRYICMKLFGLDYGREVKSPGLVRRRKYITRFPRLEVLRVKYNLYFIGIIYSCDDLNIII